MDTALLLKILPWTDWLFVDLKHMDSGAHRAGTGAGNELALANIAAVATAGWAGRLVIRVPIVPGFNDDTVDNLQATASFLAAHRLREINLLPFHRLGASEYEQLGLSYPYAHVATPSLEEMQAHQRVFETAGLRCYVGFETPF